MPLLHAVTRDTGVMVELKAYEQHRMLTRTRAPRDEHGQGNKGGRTSPPAAGRVGAVGGRPRAAGGAVPDEDVAETGPLAPPSFSKVLTSLKGGWRPAVARAADARVMPAALAQGGVGSPAQGARNVGSAGSMVTDEEGWRLLQGLALL